MSPYPARPPPPGPPAAPPSCSPLVELRLEGGSGFRRSQHGQEVSGKLTWCVCVHAYMCEGVCVCMRTCVCVCKHVPMQAQGSAVKCLCFCQLWPESCPAHRLSHRQVASSGQAPPPHTVFPSRAGAGEQAPGHMQRALPSHFLSHFPCAVVARTVVTSEGNGCLARELRLEGRLTCRRALRHGRSSVPTRGLEGGVWGDVKWGRW